MQSEDKEVTLKIWRESLRVLLGWTDAQTTEWGERFFCSVSEGTIYHRGIMRYVVAAVIPRSLSARLSLGERLRLEDRLNDAVVKQSAKSSPDWLSAKADVETIVAEYGETLGPR